MAIVLFTGGARSGKSSSAERYAAHLDRPVVYIATAEPGDGEMRERIAAHQRRRPAAWRTLEIPLAVSAALDGLEAGSVVLLDCLALLVSNLLLSDETHAQQLVEQEIANMIAAAQAHDLQLIVVTNEVGMGVVPAYPLGRSYRDLLGRANQQIAAASSEVYLLVCGIPVELRAFAPDWAQLC